MFAFQSFETSSSRRHCKSFIGEFLKGFIKLKVDQKGQDVSPTGPLCGRLRWCWFQGATEPLKLEPRKGRKKCQGKMLEVGQSVGNTTMNSRPEL